MNKQQLLNDLYETHWDEITEIRNKNPGLSAPILVKYPVSYMSQKVKLMIVGQQTQGWCDGGINDLLACYEDFNFGESYYASPFWNITRKIEKILNIDAYAIIWSNLNRCDFNSERPTDKIEKDLMALSKMLAVEIEILEPNIVLFFSGPNFDEHIKSSFSGCCFESVKGFTQRELLRVQHELLPSHAYRVYHPKYMRIRGIEPRFIEYVESINT